jgi:hypothetical protein
MRRLIRSRPLVLAFAVLVPAAFAAPSAQARPAHVASAAATQAPGCVVHSLPSFIAQGEFATAATVADVIEVECNPFIYGTGAEVTLTASQLYSRCHEVTWYDPSRLGVEELSVYSGGSGRSFSLHLDVNGNATAALIAGPHCMVGESLITLDENEAPFETFTTSFQVLPAVNTPEGVQATPASQVEDAETSSVATIVQAEFDQASEAHVRLAAGQLYSRCDRGEKLLWVRENREVVRGPELAGENAVELDNNGNGFALALGSDSCAEGASLIEADLESSPFTTVTTEFTVLPPQPTAEPAFTIEKSQRIAGAGGAFTTKPLLAAVGEDVEYEILVTNTSAVSETLTNFTDGHCDIGTITGGPGSSALSPGASATYACSHQLTAGGTYVNEASVTASTVGGLPVEQTSNQVEVSTQAATPSFTIEKLQQIAGSSTGFTTATLTGLIGQTADYEIRVMNTGNVPLSLSKFSDPQCDAGTLAGGPGSAQLAVGESTTYTCSHLLASQGSLVNVATVTATPPGEPETTKSSAPVEVVVQTGESSFTITKRQRIAGSGESFSASQLTGAVGARVEYEIVVTNTGKVALAVTSFADPHCDAGTLAGGPGGSPISPGAATTYTCSHLLGSESKFVNVASVSAAPPGEKPQQLESNEVVVLVGALPPGAKPGSTPPGGAVLGICEVSRPVLRGLSGSERGPFMVTVRSTGIRQITFYLDGRKQQTMKNSQAKGGSFRLKLDARKLRFGVHRVSFKTLMQNNACAQTAATRPFVRPKALVLPRFTG